MSEYRSIKMHVLAKLEDSLPTLQEKFGVETIGIFGSVSRGEDTAESDVDVLVAFRKDAYTLSNLVYLADYLEELFQRKVDLLPDDGVSRYLKPYVENEVILIEA